jgi:two-component system, NarL family, response regulator DevR
MQRPIRILLVDDNLHFLNAAQDYLQAQEGFRVIGTATNLQEAHAQAELLHPDVILLDLTLGNHSGLELIPHFRWNLPAVKIIVLTILAGDGYCPVAIQAGADAFIHKTKLTTRLIPVIYDLMNASPPAPLK